MKKINREEAEQMLTALQENGLSIRVEKAGALIFQSTEPMLKPLLHGLQQHGPDMAGATVIDKIMGLAAAWLCIIAGVERVVTPLASRPAVDALESRGIDCYARRIVPQIMNRDNSGPCPMEQLASGFSSPEAFYDEMRRRVKG